MIDPIIRQRYGYGAARLCVRAQPYRPDPPPPLRDAIAVARESLGPGSLARAGVALFLAALLAQGLWNALDDPDDLLEMHVVLLEESVPEALTELAALEQPEPPAPPTREPRPHSTPLPEPVEVAMHEPPAELAPPPVRERPAAPKRTRPVVELAALPHEVRAPGPAPQRARVERPHSQPRERRPDLAMTPVAPEAPQHQPFRTARVERHAASAKTSTRPRPSVAVAALPGTPSAPLDTPAPPPRRPELVRSARSSNRPRPSLPTPSAPRAPATGGGSSRPTRAARRAPKRTPRASTRISAPGVPTARPVPISPRTLSGSARLDERPPEQPTRPARRREPEKHLEGVTLGSLASCVSDREEDVLKQRLLVAVGSREECVSAAGRYRFVETRNLNAFLMWIDRAPHRGEADRCVELSLALECLK